MEIELSSAITNLIRFVILFLNEVVVFFYRLFFFLFVAITCLFSTDVPRVEEGCFYCKHLKIQISYNGRNLDCNFLDEHINMAEIIKSDADEGQYSSMIRFTPVFFKKESIELGNPIFITPFNSLEISREISFEVGFASGLFNKESKDPVMLSATPVSINVQKKIKHYEFAYTLA